MPSLHSFLVLSCFWKKKGSTFEIITKTISLNEVSFQQQNRNRE
uniref:Uncharacterized protein n=1 Tax=Vitis vinifera TaxID=29760 RepID=A5BFZ6_VITVI|nr:hypothetical protein VITISV_035340 [Vitis vinifera]